MIVSNNVIYMTHFLICTLGRGRVDFAQNIVFVIYMHEVELRKSFRQFIKSLNIINGVVFIFLRNSMPRIHVFSAFNNAQ